VIPRTPFDFTGNTLLLMMGLPYSGKSTQALATSRIINAPIVSPDAIRIALSGHRFLSPLEPTVWWVARMTVRSLFLAGHPIVILDATNNTRARREEWRSSEGWEVLVLEIDTPAAECIRRAQAANDEEIVPVIERMLSTREPLEADERPADFDELVRLWATPKPWPELT